MGNLHEVQRFALLETPEDLGRDLLMCRRLGIVDAFDEVGVVL